ncbi:YtxH domain-containing protein [Paenibacillus xerothermodurans]|uniref:YtxH domain-containing protein n=1 Tax=Paenibacillus xerothermodurans TaxID=1977292 RepID=A0A2W1N8R5_PAEXE|nr:YtxH domain-containing protein [Paenibacillus xerothermodurans]PZE21009.1 YtxH domain-containing protein [Paenibacillus xerothermodurans]
MRSDKKGKDLLVGAVVGTVLGAVAALLLAPKSGRELRADIAARAHTVSEKTQEVAGSVTERSKKIAGVISEKTQQAAETISRQTYGWKEKARVTALAWKNGRAAAEEHGEAPVAATIVEKEDQQS